MLKRVLNRREILLCSVLPAVGESDYEEFKRRKGLYLANPWDRVKTIFIKDDHGNFHPELVSALQNTQFGLLVGFFVGGLPHSIEKMRQYMDRNDATVYLNKKVANRFLSRQSAFGFVLGGIRECPKYAFFFGGFSLISAMVEAYRNRSGVIEFTIAGSTVGALCRFWFGIRGLFVGGLIGGILGTVYGCVIWCTLKVLGKDALQIKHAQYALSEHRKQLRSYNAAPATPDSLESHHEGHLKNPLDNLVEGNG